MSKPNYRATVIYDLERKLFVARAPELEHCTAEGASRGEALGKLEEEIDAQLANMLSHGTTPPRSVDEESFSGEISARVSRLLHRELATQARLEGVDLDHLIGELLSAALEGRKQTRGTRSGNRPVHDGGSDNIGNRQDGRGRGFGGGRGSNMHLLDDRANFIEYVRGLEQQSHGPTRNHGGGGGGAGGGLAGGGRRRRGRGGNPSHHSGPHRGPGNNGGRPNGGHVHAHDGQSVSSAPETGASSAPAGSSEEPDGNV